MKNLFTIPSAEKIRHEVYRTPEYMRPSTMPTAVVMEGFLLENECDWLVAYLSSLESYNYDHCSALTREAPRPLDGLLDSSVMAAETVNDSYWGFELDVDPAAWFQTYSAGRSYPLHADFAPGQSRKMTAVVMLSDEEAYAGGELRVRINSERGIAVPKTRGTIVVFPAWVPHLVTEVTWGVRQTINIGFWGPDFR